MSYFEVFGVLTGVGVEGSKFFEVGAGVLKRGAGVESDSEKCDSSHLWYKPELYRIRISGLESCRIQHILNKPDRVRTTVFKFPDQDQDFRISLFWDLMPT